MFVIFTIVYILRDVVQIKVKEKILIWEDGGCMGFTQNFRVKLIVLVSFAMSCCMLLTVALIIKQDSAGSDDYGWGVEFAMFIMKT